jgi:diguanylate cyclase (GGDEF)-like protein
VLLISNDAPAVECARTWLERGGFALRVAACAPVLPEDEAPALVLIDARACAPAAIELCESLQRGPAAHRAPVVVWTAQGDAESVTRAYEAGARDFVAGEPDALWLERLRFAARAVREDEALRQAHARLASAQRIAHLGAFEHELASGELWCSEETSSLLGREPGACRSFESLLDATHPSDREELDDALDHALHHSGRWSLDHRVLLPNGEGRVLAARGEVEYDPEGEPLRLLGTLQDMTERKRAQERMEQLACYDGLTGLPNRRLFRQRLDQAVRHAARHGRQVALLLIDLDRFRRFNETLGPSAGDQLLECVASRLTERVRLSDVVVPSDRGASAAVSRLGGDEFTILLSEINDAQDAARVAKRLLQVLSEPIKVDGREVFLTVSIGIAVHPLDGQSADELLRNADAATSHAKRRGRNNYQFYTGSMNEQALYRLEFEAELRHAVENGQLVLHYQPKVRIRDRRLTGVEALVRWMHPRLGKVPPAEFIALAEETGLIVPLGEWVLREACRQSRAWEREGHGAVTVAVNLSSHQFSRPGLADVVRGILEETGLDPRRLELELTESALVQDEGAAVRILESLRATGVRLALDDFGTGYSSLSYLRRFPIDALKIDRAFVIDIASDPQVAAIVAAIVQMARSLRLEVVAEGVETAEQEEALGRAGVDQMQGWRVGRPVPAADCIRFFG